RDHLVDLVPARTSEPAQAAHGLPALARFLVADDRRPGQHRRHRVPCFAPGLEQAAAHHRVFDAIGAVQIPAVTGAARTTTRLVVGHVPARARVVGLLGFPGDDAALDVDLPRARARAVHTMRAAHDLVVGPAVAVGVLPGAVFAGGLAMIAGEALAGLRKIGQSVEKVAHEMSSFDAVIPGLTRDPWWCANVDAGSSPA